MFILEVRGYWTVSDKHFEQLAVDRNDVSFDDQYHKTNSYEVSIITELVKDEEIPEVTITELTKAIKTFNKAKAPDFYGMQTEHILNARDAAIPFLLEIVNQILGWPLVCDCGIF